MSNNQLDIFEEKIILPGKVSLEATIDAILFLQNVIDMNQHIEECQGVDLNPMLEKFFKHV